MLWIRVNDRFWHLTAKTPDRQGKRERERERERESVLWLVVGVGGSTNKSYDH